MASATPLQAAQIPSALPRSRESRQMTRTMARDAGISSAAPTPATARAPIRIPIEGENAATTEASGEDCRAEDENPAPADEIGQQSAGQEQDGISQVVGVDHPLERAYARVEVRADPVRAEIDDRGIDLRDEYGQAQREQCRKMADRETVRSVPVPMHGGIQACLLHVRLRPYVAPCLQTRNIRTGTPPPNCSLPPSGRVRFGAYRNFRSFGSGTVEAMAEQGHPELPGFSGTAFLLADPARAVMLTALLGGRALPAGELAYAARVTAQTASSHLAKLLAGGLVALEVEGRHRYYRLAGSHVAQALEHLAAIRPETQIRPPRAEPRGAALALLPQLL